MPLKAATNTPRGLAVEILNRVAITDAYAEPLLDACLSSHYLPNIHDRRLLTQIVYGVLRMRGRLDWIIRTYYKGDVESLDIYIRNILRTGLYQLLYTSRIPFFAVVDEAVKLAKVHQPAGAGLVNAILRTYLRKREELVYPRLEEDPLEHITVVHSHPAWLVRRWMKVLGVEKTLALCAANNEIPPAALRVNLLKTSRDEAKAELAAEGIETQETVFSLQGLVITGQDTSLRTTQSYAKGLVLLQDEASQLIAPLLAPPPGETVLDLCAGTGIKTTHLAELMADRGEIMAVDIKERKLVSLRELAGKLGVTIIETMVGDAAAEPPAIWRQKFDRVLVDAPCSGLGTIRRNPEIKWRLKERDIELNADLQRRILDRAASCTKMGGIMVYGVCTIMTEENEAVIDAFLGRHGEFRLVAPPAAIDRRLVDEKGFFRTNPARHGTDGFFGAVLVRKHE